MSDYVGTGRADMNFVAGLRTTPANVTPVKAPKSFQQDISYYQAFPSNAQRKQSMCNAKLVNDLTRRLSPLRERNQDPRNSVAVRERRGSHVSNR